MNYKIYIFRDDVIADAIDDNNMTLDVLIEFNPVIMYDDVTGHLFFKFEW